MNHSYQDSRADASERQLLSCAGVSDEADCRHDLGDMISGEYGDVHVSVCSELGRS